MKRIIILGAGLYYGKAIEKVRNGGFHVIAVDRDPQAPGRLQADEFFPIDIIDVEAVLRLAREKAIHGIMHLNEFGSKTASYVSQEMGLNGYSRECIESTNDKGLMRDLWHLKKLRMPRYCTVDNLQEAHEAIRLIGYPCVFKPTDSGGSGRGVSVIKSEKDVEWAIDFARPHARNGRFIAEQFIDGLELTVETFSLDGKTHFLAMSDKVKPDLRTRVALSLNFPALISNEVRDRVRTLVGDALSALGIQNGIAHTEVIVDASGEPFLVETGARGGGGHIFHTIIEAVSGFDAPVMQAKWLTGERPVIGDLTENGCCYRFFNPVKGVLKSVLNVERAASVDGVVDFGIVKKVGDEVGNLENSQHRAGFVVSRAPTRNGAIEIADKVEGILVFNVDPSH